MSRQQLPGLIHEICMSSYMKADHGLSGHMFRQQLPEQTLETIGRESEIERRSLSVTAALQFQNVYEYLYERSRSSLRSYVLPTTTRTTTLEC